MSSVLISRNGGAQMRIGGTQAAKESRNGIVLDLMPYLVNNEHINIGDIEDSIWETMITDGHCYYMYDSFTFNGFWGKRDCMLNMTDISFEQMFSIPNPNGSVISTYYARDLLGFIVSYPFSRFVNSNGDLSFSEEQLQEAIELSLDYGLPNSSGFDMLGEDGFDHLRNNEYILTWSLMPNLLLFDEASIDAGGDICYVGFPSFESSTHVIQPQGNVAVSSSTEHPEACIDFVAILFSDEIQRRIIVGGTNSVMHSINEELFEYANNPDLIPSDLVSYRCLFARQDPVPFSVIAAYRDAISSIDTVQIYDWAVYEMINEEISTYDTQGRSLDMIADSLYSRLALYASEHYG